MDVHELLLDLFGRVSEHVHEALDGLDPRLLPVAPAAGANPIGWLVWHLARVEDAQVAEAMGVEQVWQDGTWAQRFGLAADPHNSGYGHTPAEVAEVRPEGIEALFGYFEAVAERTRNWLQQLTPADLDRIVDDRWDPPVSLGVRLISIADDEIQHGGQAAYARGLLEHR
ncbi:MAG: DUF664 domain-containing protein [Ilumatobacteraceae bacterium]